MKKVFSYLLGVLGSTAILMVVFGLAATARDHNPRELWTVLIFPAVWMACDGLMFLWRRWKRRPPMTADEVKQ